MLFPDTTPAQVEESFRRARGLLTADKLEAWLAEWQLEPEDFRRWTEDAATGSRTATAWCALLCSGRYDAVAAEVLSAAAAACELGHPPSDPQLFEPDGWTEQLLAARTTPELLAQVVAGHRLDWTQLAVQVAAVTSRAVAEELRHQVLVDGTDLPAAAAVVDAPVQQAASALAAFAPESLKAALAGARPGDLVGPLPAGSDWLLVHVLARTEPTLAEPAVRALAETTVHREVIARAVARHVVA